MKPIRFLLAALAMIGLAGCYTSDKPLVTDADSATPFQKITFYNEDNKPLAFTLDGKAYRAKGESGTPDSLLRLKPIAGDYYVAQLSSDTTPDSPEGVQILYAYMRVDPANKVADTWKIVGTKADVRPGMRECKDSICIDDLSAYVAYAQEAVTAGAKPDASFKMEAE